MKYNPRIVTYNKVPPDTRISELAYNKAIAENEALLAQNKIMREALRKERDYQMRNDFEVAPWIYNALTLPYI